MLFAWSVVWGPSLTPVRAQEDSAEKKPAALPVWSPDKAMVERLAPAVTVEGFQIQPPKGYRQQTTPGPGGSKGYAWVGETREDGTRPYLMLVVMTPPPGEAEKYTAPQVLEKFLAAIQRNRSDWKRSATEEGTVNGVRFARAQWNGTEVTTKRPMQGLMYVAFTGGRLIQISSQDVVPAPPGDPLAVAGAAALTFRTAGAEKPAPPPQ
jgi:hypothetical protein